MAQTVEYTLKLNIDGQDHVVNLSSDVKRLAEDLSVSKEGSDELRKSLLKINNITQSFQNAAQGIQELTGTLLDLTGSYATQQINETRLANNMRNTMEARDEDIQSILDLCSAQQQLGVIGDEVQLAGAQELATYLEKKSSLEALIPVMNDMLAQQYELEASEESAAQVASMLGKVMEGQTAALSRYGYSFDEAQEQILKFGTEEERAAVLAKVVESSVGGMNEALRQTPAGQAKAAADRLGDMKENIGAMIAPLQSIILSVGTFASAINTVATTATGIYGVVQALQTLDVRQKAAAVSSRALAVHQRVQATAQRLLAAAGYSAAAGTTALTVATTALYAALTLGISAAITAIVAAFSRLTGETEKYTQSAEDAHEISQAFSDTASQASAKIQVEIAQLKNLKDGTAEAATKVKELNQAYGDIFGNHKTAAEWYDTLTTKSQAYCKQLGYEAQAKVIAARKAAKELQMIENQQRMDVLIRQVSGNREKTAEYRQLRDENKHLAKDISLLNDRFETCIERAREATSEMDIAINGQQPSDTTPQPTPQKTEKRYSLIENAATYKELANNVKYYEQQLEEANITDVETIQNLVQAKAATEKAIEQFQKLSTVSQTDEQKREAELAELRASEVAHLKHEEITTQDQLSAKMTYYNRLQQLGTEEDRLRAQEGIRGLNAIAQAWDMVIDKSRFKLDETGEIDPSAIFNSEDIDAAIRFYTDRQQQEDADQVEKTQTLIDRLTERKTAIELGIELPSMKKEAEEIAALTGREYTVKVKAMGFEQIMAKIREIEELLDNPNITADQRQQLEQLRGIYAQFAKDSVRSLGTYKEAWSGIKGVGSGIESITQALEDNSNAWQKITALIDGFLQIADGIGAIVKITETLTKASQMETAADIAGAGAKKAKSAASLEATGVGAAEEAKNELVAISSGKEAAADTTSAAAKVLKAHAWIPWVGVAIGAGMVAMMIASISSVKNSMPKFATGGIVGGSSTTGDRLLVRVNSGEMILNKHQQLMLWQLLNGQRSSLSAAAIQYNVPQVSLDVPALQSQLRPYSERVVVTGTLHGRGRDILATIETEQNHRKRS